MSKQPNRIHKKITAKDATPDQFAASSIIRFGRLKNYIQEKILVDYFAVKGNLVMIEGLKNHLHTNLTYYKSKPKIKLLDVGPAIGAMSTLLVLQALDDFNLIDKTQVYLVDISANVIDHTQQCDFSFPDSVISPGLKGKILKKLRESRAHVGSAEDMPWKDNEFDIIIAAFLFHHLHDTLKAPVAKEIHRVLSPTGALCISDEWFKNYEKDYAKKHLNDPIPLAYESIIPYKKLIKLFPKLKVSFKHGTDA
ncbi:MAG: class I SAM-dependent methyltransferase, partial [Candidatus Peregrinibacteria bacterium]